MSMTPLEKYQNHLQNYLLMEDHLNTLRTEAFAEWFLARQACSHVVSQVHCIAGGEYAECLNCGQVLF